MNKLAIVGTHPRTRGDAPFDDPAYDIWVFNEAPMAEWCKRWDAVFQLHKPEVYTSPHNMSNKRHWEWLQQEHPGKAVWMQHEDLRVPACRRYPLEEILSSIPGAILRWFDLSAAYALALAIYQGYEEIAIYGMDLVSNTEYSYQLRCWNFWVGVALGTGIRIDFHCEEGDFGSGRMYGYEGEIQIERELFADRIHYLENAWKHADWELHKGKNRVDQALELGMRDKVPELLTVWQNLALAAGEVSGALAEAQNYVKRDDLISRQEFEKRSAQAQREGEGLRALMYQTSGKVEYVWNVWRQTGRPEALLQLRRFIGEQMEKAFDTGGRLGIYKENLHYMQELDKRITAAGGQKTLEAVNG